jgi:hypothetical protein
MRRHGRLWQNITGEMMRQMASAENSTTQYRNSYPNELLPDPKGDAGRTHGWAGTTEAKRLDMEIHDQPGNENAARIDFEPMIASIWEEMHGLIDRGVILQALEEALAKYQNARIQTFVPILLRRDVTEKLLQPVRDIGHLQA